MHRLVGRLPLLPTALRVALALFVVAWILGPYELRSAVPVWIAFLIALGLELNSSSARSDARRRRGRTAGPSRSTGSATATSAGWTAARRTTELTTPESGVRFAASSSAWASSAGRALSGSSRAGRAGTRSPSRPAPRRRIASSGGLDDREKPVRIRCDESGEYVGAVQHADGIATVGGDLAYLTPERCLDLYRLAFEGEVTSSQTARAIAVLAHEAWHLHGIRDEGTTECYALQSGVGLGQRLGLSEGTAEQMMRQQLAENAGRSGSGTEYVVPPSCRGGGALDLDPERAGFP